MPTATAAFTESTCTLRGTGGRAGRTLIVEPGATLMRCLHHARIIGTDTSGPAEFHTGEKETAFICLTGRAFIVAADDLYELGPYDSLYVPPATDIRVDADGIGCDLAEFGASVETEYPVQFIPAPQIPAEGDVAISMQSTCISAGLRFGQLGSWTVWPPEPVEHFEQAHLFIDMPGDAWGIQTIGSRPDEPEIATVVRQYDCVLIPAGFHANVAAPGGRLAFLWMRVPHIK